MIELFDKIRESHENKKGKISLWSYKRFCMFYNYVVYNDNNFEEKMNKIIEYVKVYNMSDIREIGDKIGTDITDCIFRLRYLKNKRLLDQEYFINSHTNEIKKCSSSDLELINKYYESVYLMHYSIKEMAERVCKDDPSLDLAQVQNDIYKELEYLNSISLLSGIKLDELRHEISYYTLEKKNKSKIFATISCPNCGALVDVLKYNEGKCGYCGTIVEDTYSRKEEL